MRIGQNFIARHLGVRLASGAGARQPVSVPARHVPAAHLPGALWTLLSRTIIEERDRWFPWIVVAFAGGAGVYFALKTEPSVALVGGAGAAGVLIVALGVHSGSILFRLACALIAASLFGFGAAKLRTERIAAPVIGRDIGALTIEGRVEQVFVQDATRARIVLAPTRIGRDMENLPRRVRVSLRGEKAVAAVAPGAAISLLAMLRPPPEPAQPGGYDFARWAFFSGIGGVGFGLGAPKPLGVEEPESSRRDFSERIENLRLAMSARIRAALPGPEGAISAALITGDRAAISEEDNNAYRDSGLFHVLSISGLHMALAGLGVFWIVRALLALWPRLALTQPIKKWAAVAALMGATFYLFISGAGAPAVRSYIMLSAMLIAVLADRPALNMRAVGISALLILMIEPEGVIEPSFQMSFAAIIGLIALAEWHRGRRRDTAPEPSRFLRAFRWSRRYVLGLVLTSVVAGLCTAPLAIYHFDRAPGYSLLSNLMATPVVGVVIMPAACFTVVLMPFGLEYWPLQIMGWGVRSMTDIAHFVAGLPGAVGLLPAWSNTVLLLIVAGGLWAGLWQKKWRWFGSVPIAAGLLLSVSEKPPDVIVARDASALAVRGADGRFTLIGKPDAYTAEQWLLRDGDARSADEAMGASCDEFGCVGVLPDGRMVALALRLGALADDCARAEVVVSAAPLRRPCRGPAQVIDRFDVAREGAYALWLDGAEIRAVSVAEVRGLRPWSGLSRGE